MHLPLSKFPRIQYRRVWQLSLVALVCLLSYIPMRLAIAKQSAPHPEMILVLGGGPDREQLAARLAQDHPNLEVWISTGSSEAAQIFQRAGIDQSRVHFDCRATDTVTNFTTSVDTLKQRGIQHVYVVSSSFHMPRSQVIATIVFGSQGIAFTPVAVATPNFEPESKVRIVRDLGRSMLWLATGRTGASLNREPGLCQNART
jgi:uncharacterized SAM-binding protein YcdF (DUF218 family)